MMKQVMHRPPFALLAALLLCLSPLSANAQAELEALRSQAASGNGKTQWELAARYRDGTGVVKDEAEALKWAHQAADGGHAEAMDFVGSAYLRGSIIKRNPVIALGYFKAAAEQSTQAAFNLGQCYFGGQGTEQDVPKALEYWKKAAEAGHGRAAACAAMAYLSGEGVPCDAALARRLAERAAELNDPSGLVLLGELQFQAGELDAAKANWTKASKLRPTGPTGHPAQPSANASAQQGADLLKLIAGFDQATAFLKGELDAGRPVVVDFKYIGPQYPGGSAGHTLNVCGYIAEESLYILCNPAVATPGLQLISAADLKNFWRSDHYGALSKGILSRPAFAIERP